MKNKSLLISGLMTGLFSMAYTQTLPLHPSVRTYRVYTSFLANPIGVKYW
jgi:hypothetical protein